MQNKAGGAPKAKRTNAKKAGGNAKVASAKKAASQSQINITEDGALPPAKRLKITETAPAQAATPFTPSATFPELHQRTISGDGSAFAEIFKNPVFAHKYKVINGAEQLQETEILPILNEGYPALLKVLFQDVIKVITAIGRLNNDAAINHAKLFHKQVRAHVNEINDKKLFLMCLEAAIADHKKSSATQGSTSYSYWVIAEYLLGRLESSFNRLSDPLNTFQNLFPNLFMQLVLLIDSRMGDVEKMIVMIYKSAVLRNRTRDNRFYSSPFGAAISKHNFELVRTLYLMDEYKLSTEEYFEFILFKAEFHQTHDMSYGTFAREDTSSLQYVLMDKTTFKGFSYFRKIYGENFEKFLKRSGYFPTLCIQQFKSLKAEDKSEDAETLRQYKNFLDLNPVDQSVHNSLDEAVISAREQLPRYVNFAINLSIGGKIESLTPMELAIKTKNEGVIEEFLNLGADPNFYFTNPPLALAIKEGLSIEIIYKLLSAGASPYLGKVNAITLAANNKRIDILNLFHSCGISLDFGDFYKRPIIIAIEEDDSQMMRFLLQRNVSPVIEYTHIIHFAAQESKLNALTVILELGYGQTVDSFGYTPLHTAAWCGSAESLHILMNKDLDPHAKTNSGISCLGLAILSKNSEKIRLFLSLGVSMGTVNHDISKSFKELEDNSLKSEISQYREKYNRGLITPKKYRDILSELESETPSSDYIEVGEGAANGAQQQITSVAEMSQQFAYGQSSQFMAASAAPLSQPIRTAEQFETSSSLPSMTTLTKNLPPLEEAQIEDLMSMISASEPYAPSQNPNFPSLGF